MNLIDRKDSRFISYIDVGNFEVDISLVQEHRRKLLEGEQLIHESQNIILHDPLTNSKQDDGITGLLTITTFKLSFTPANGIDREIEEYYQSSNLLGPYEVCLSAIDTIYQMVNNSKKKLYPCQNVSSKIKELLVVCKNMRSLWFNFRNVDKDNGRTVANTLLHHVYPKRHSLLFAYDYFHNTNGERIYNNKPHNGKKTRMFRCLDDWKEELKRTGCENWRITLINEAFDPCPHLPRYLIVPKSVMDSHLLRSLRHFRNECFPVWVWGCKDVALVRMSDLLSSITERTAENTLLEKVRESHPGRKQPVILDLERECPLPRDVRLSYQKLRDLCTPVTRKELRAQDNKYLSLLDGSRWLQAVSSCLTVATGAASQLLEGTTVVLQEGNGQDMNCVISSLVQILLDPLPRTKNGFQSLLQKDWLAMGHPFASRLGHVLDPRLEMSPLFLLFLDCVWQLLDQFPTAFQYSETYLTTVWDVAHVSAFETFLFNGEHQRVLAENDKNSSFRSVWDWSEQFSPTGNTGNTVGKDIVVFCNPLYDDSFTGRLEPLVSLPHLSLWHQCYLRWLPPLEVPCGGRSAHIDVSMRHVATEINILRRHLATTTSNSSSSSSSSNRDTTTITNGTTTLLRHSGGGSGSDITLRHVGGESGGGGLVARSTESLLEYLEHVNSFFPFSLMRTQRHLLLSRALDYHQLDDNDDAQSQHSSS